MYAFFYFEVHHSFKLFFFHIHSNNLIFFQNNHIKFVTFIIFTKKVGEYSK